MSGNKEGQDSSTALLPNSGGESPSKVVTKVNSLEVPKKTRSPKRQSTSNGMLSFEVEAATTEMWSRPSGARITMLEEIQNLRSTSASSLNLSTQGRARRIVLGFPWQAVFSAAMLTDLVVLIRFWKLGVSSACIKSDACWYGYASWGMLVTLFHGTDSLLRMVAFGWAHFCKRPLCLLDLYVAVLCVVSWTIVVYDREGNARDDHLYLAVWITVLRGLRVIRLARQLCMCPCRKIMVYGVSGNRRRYIDLSEDFDLDLTYVTERVIAMSVPIDIMSQSCCRNLLSDVARFFDTRHRHKYLIVNACPELPYPASAFQTGLVARFDIQDHTPPTMEQFLQFIKAAWSFMRDDPDKTLAVHCKAGKGRTGSLVVAWLLYARNCDSLQDALACFALARSDFTVSLQIHGVETPSQVRYLAQFAELCRSQNAYEGVELKMPKKMNVRLLELSFQNVWKQPPPSKMIVAVHKVFGKDVVIDDGKDGASSEGTYSHVVAWSDPFDVTVENVPLVGTLAGDVRISVFDVQKLEKERKRSSEGRAFPGDTREQGTTDSHSKTTPNVNVPRMVAGTEPGCLFYFMFHTAFLNGDGTLKVTMGSDTEFHGMDKAWKQARKYNMNGCVVLQCSYEF